MGLLNCSSSLERGFGGATCAPLLNQPLFVTYRACEKFALLYVTLDLVAPAHHSSKRVLKLPILAAKHLKDVDTLDVVGCADVRDSRAARWSWFLLRDDQALRFD